MADVAIFITDKDLARLPFAKRGQYRVHDTEVKGFPIVVGTRTKTFTARAAFWREGVREFSTTKKIGEFGDMTSRAARGKAKDIIVGITKGQRPGESQRTQAGAITPRQAWERSQHEIVTID